MPQTSAERARLTRDRRRRGVRPVLVEISPEVVEFLEVNGYLPDRDRCRDRCRTLTLPGGFGLRVSLQNALA
jgi:hypothetical protein